MIHVHLKRGGVPKTYTTMKNFLTQFGFLRFLRLYGTQKTIERLGILQCVCFCHLLRQLLGLFRPCKGVIRLVCRSLRRWG